jgi:hypothetical protein
MFHTIESISVHAIKWWTPSCQRYVDAMHRSTALLTAVELCEVWIRDYSDDAFAAKRCVTT